MFSSNLIIGHKNTLDTLVNLYYENNLPKKISVPPIQEIVPMQCIYNYSR